MSGAAHQPHELAAGDDCLAADSFAPPPLGDDWTAEDFIAEADDAAAGREPGPAEGHGEPAGEFWPGAGEYEAAACADVAPQTAAPAGWTTDDGFVDPLEPAEAGFDPFAPALPDFACELDDPPEPCIVPPPVAIAPGERPVPDGPPEPRRRRKRLRGFVCAFLAVLAGEIALDVWRTPSPEILVRDIAVAHGIHPDDFVRIAEIESRLDPNAFNRRSRAAGLFQLMPGTAKQYEVADSFDAKANAEAAARLLKHNAGRLKKALGRAPIAWELYLAHQQGATGAIKLLTNPDKKAVEVVGRLPVLWNRGTEDMTATQFAAMWREAFRGGKTSAAVN